MSSEQKRRCQGLTKAGRPCRGWALREGPNPEGRWLCRRHAEAARQEAVEVIEGLQEVVGRPAQGGTVVPAGSWAGAFEGRQLYGVFFDEEEVAALEAVATGGTDAAQLAESLAAEIEVVRVVLRRLLAEVAEAGDLLKLTPLMLESARTVAGLLRDKQVLQELAAQSGNHLGFDWDEVLDILNEKYEAEL